MNPVYTLVMPNSGWTRRRPPGAELIREDGEGRRRSAAVR
jgi:hypothetical protein